MLILVFIFSKLLCWISTGVVFSCSSTFSRLCQYLWASSKTKAQWVEKVQNWKYVFHAFITIHNVSRDERLFISHPSFFWIQVKQTPQQDYGFSKLKAQRGSLRHSNLRFPRSLSNQILLPLNDFLVRNHVSQKGARAVGSSRTTTTRTLCSSPPVSQEFSGCLTGQLCLCNRGNRCSGSKTRHPWVAQSSIPASYHSNKGKEKQKCKSI